MINCKLILNFFFCMDNCGVNVNWYIVFDFMKGWSVWLMFLGWFNIMYFDWYVVVEMLNVMRGL